MAFFENPHVPSGLSYITNQILVRVLSTWFESKISNSFNREHLLSKGHLLLLPCLRIFKQRFKRYWANTICTKTSSLTLTLDHVTWTWIMVIYLLEASSAPGLGTFQQRGKGDQQNDFDLWSCDLKINRKHLISRDIHCTQFCNFQAKGSKDIERTLLSL